MLPTITVMGNLSRIETKVLQSGKEMTSFQIECSEKNSKGEYQNLYLKGEVWEKSSKFLSQYFNDGSVAIVTGKLYTNVYQKQDGSKVYENKLLFPNVSFAPKEKGIPQETQGGNQSNYQQKNENKGGYQAQQKSQEFPDIDDSDSDIPF